MTSARWSVLSISTLVMTGAACSSSSFSTAGSGAQNGADASTSGGATNGGGRNGTGNANNAGGVMNNAGGVSNAGGVTSNAGGVTSNAGGAGGAGDGGAQGVGGGVGAGGSSSDAGIHADCGGLPPPEPKPLAEPLIPNPDPTATLSKIVISGPPSMYSTGSANTSTSVILRDQGVYSDGTVRSIDNIYADINYHTQVTWTSSDPSIAAVSSGDTRTAGGMRGLREGTVTITVSLGAVSTSVCFVVTPPAVAGLTIAAPSSMPSNLLAPIVARPADTIPLTCFKTMTDGAQVDVTNGVTWASSDTSIATVSPTGSSQALSAGTTVITATLPAWVQAISQAAKTGTATLDVIGSTGLQQGADCTSQSCAAGLSCCTTGRFGPPYCIPTLSPSSPCPPPPPATP